MAYAQPPKKTGLPRLVLKWLQSLDLSFSPKNVPLYRDFSNGYLVAEIFSRHYPKHFSMHYYDKGISLSAKQHNWSQLERFLQKQNIRLKKEVIEGTIHCKPGAAELLVQEVYTILTNQRIEGALGRDADFTDWKYQRQLPHVVRSTAARAVKNNLRSSEIQAEPDITATQRKAVALIDMHWEHRAEERLENPERFKAKSTTGWLSAFPSLPAFRGDKGSETFAPVGSTSKMCCSSIQCEDPVSFKEIHIHQPLPPQVYY